MNPDTEEKTPERDETTHSFPPSHILQDGRFIFLPEPSIQERTKFLERSIARHKLLTEKVNEAADGVDAGAGAGANKNGKDGEDEQERDGTKEEDSKQHKVHPLAVASARLQANGVSELSKAINLSGLVSTGEFFGLSNIVNPQLEAGIDKTTSDKEVEVPVNSEDVALRALYLGKRKRAQFQWAAEALERHEKRLASAIATQQIIDQRLLELRPRWRLVAPEHGTRARPHSTRPTEVIAIDVHVYDRDRTGGSHQMVLRAQHHAAATTRASAIGLARLVPRYATVELPKDYKATKDVNYWRSAHDLNREAKMDEDHTADDSCKTRAEPFAVADPTLGKIDVDFNPDKVPMLSLQLDIEKDFTGFRQYARLSPLTTLGDNASEDEKVVVALQHSLFCASLFESIRRELIPEDDDAPLVVDARQSASMAHQQTQFWLSSAMQEQYLPTSARVGAFSESGESLAIVHCHEGEVKVQLDSEYTLSIKLVEAMTAETSDENSQSIHDEMNGSTSLSGTQSPQQLHALCRALLLHAQDVYHQHSIELREYMEKKMAEDENASRRMGLEVRRKKEELPCARIMQSCVSLGARMIFERKVRWALSRVKQRLAMLASTSATNNLVVEWLPLPVLGKCSQFVLRYESLVIDVCMTRDEMTVTGFGENGEYRKVVFHSEQEFETFLKLELRRLVKVT